MILYLDASSLVKLYLVERDSEEVETVVREADTLGTAMVSRAEVSAALSKAVRMRAVAAEAALNGLRQFRTEWPDFARVPVSQAVVSRADALAWEYGLRGYDAVHLASALTWSEAMGQQVTLSTFDRQLWLAAQQTGLQVHPPGLLTRPKAGI